MPETIAIILLLIGIAVVFYSLIQYRTENISLRAKYEKIINIDAEVNNRRTTVNDLDLKIEELKSSFDKQNAELSQNYSQARALYDQLQAEIAIIEESLEMTSFGIYKPHFDFDTSERYKLELEARRQKQKDLIKSERAAICRIEWTVDGSKAKGKKQTKELIKLMLRAFNGECDAANLKIKWNNAPQMEQRIVKSFEAVNKLASTQQTYITEDYLKLKLEELYLTHEYQLKKYEEQEEQRRIREQIREEERAQKEFEKAQKEADAEEKRYADALRKARLDVEKAKGKQLSQLNEQIAALELQLAETRAQKERAISRAQLTKSGFVYVISNLGSFGDNMYKIGMTRRLDPMDRVRELGDASVPFQFDVHAIIDSDNAPELENRLHRLFDERRVNRVNTRKEFFFVSLKEIEQAVRDNHGEIEFTLLAEAQEYRQSEELRNTSETRNAKVAGNLFPETLVPAINTPTAEKLT